MFPELDVSPEIYSRPFPHFSKPKIIGYFSIDGERKYRGDLSQIKFIKNCENKTVHYDLNLNKEETKSKKPYDEKINSLLYFLQQNELRLGFSLEKSKFFSGRGTLCFVAGIPYENQDTLRSVAVLFKGNIYLNENIGTEEAMESIKNRSDRQKLGTSWGYKFEQFISTDNPDSDPDPNTPLNENEEFYLVQTMQLNRHTLVCMAEMDGILCDSETTMPPTEESGPENIIEYLSKQTFIEIKTSKQMPYKNAYNNSFRKYKTKNWFSQCFLSNIDTILCGFRTEDGIVEDLKVYKLEDLVEESQRYWSPNVMFNFLDAYLTYVKKCFEVKIRSKYGEEGLRNIKQLPVIALKFEWSPYGPVTVTDEFNYDDDPLLPTWFIDHYGKA